MRKEWLYLVCVAALAVGGLFFCFVRKHISPPSGLAGLDEVIGEALGENGGLEASVWVSGATGEPWYAWQASVPRPAASAVNTALLVEFLAKYRGNLDGSTPELARVSDDDSHPAVAGLDAPEQQAVRRGLEGSTVRRLGQLMMGKIPETNDVYNAAATLIIADLGGPDAATEKVRRRDPAFAGITLGRYMLTARQPHDNEATAASLAAVLRSLATGRVPGVDDRTAQAMRQAMLTEDDPVLGPCFRKDGDLYSDPLAVVRSGWFETQRGPVVFVIMTAQPTPGDDSRELACRRQNQTTESLTQRVLEAAQAESRRRQVEATDVPRRVPVSW